MESQSTQTENKSQKSKRVLKWALVVSIAIVLNLFFNYAISLAYPSPKFENFCPNEVVNRVYNDKDSCVATGGQWSETTVPVSVKSTTPVQDGTEVTGYCNPTYTCGEKYTNVQSVYNRNVFIGLVVLGVLALVAGFYLASFGAVALGLSFGGVISLIIGAARYWSDMHDWLRVVVLGVALIALIWLGIKKLKE